MPVPARVAVIKEVSGPLSETKKITMVSSGTGDVGASKLSGEVLSIVTQVPQLVKTMTGVDIMRTIHAETRTMK